MKCPECSKTMIVVSETVTRCDECGITADKNNTKAHELLTEQENKLVEKLSKMNNMHVFDGNHQASKIGMGLNIADFMSKLPIGSTVEAVEGHNATYDAINVIEAWV